MWQRQSYIPICILTKQTVLTVYIFFAFSTPYRGSKADMQAAASGGEVPPGDNEQILQNEMPAY